MHTHTHTNVDAPSTYIYSTMILNILNRTEQTDKLNPKFNPKSGSNQPQ